MIKILIIFVFNFLLFSCSTRLDPKAILADKSILLNQVKKTTQKEASYWIQNQINFLTMLFEQSRDPYYGVPKWTEQCLHENKIGKLKQTESGLYAVSELYLKDGSPGHCSNSSGSKKYALMLIFCNKTESLYEVKLPWKEELKDLNESLCEGLVKN